MKTLHLYQLRWRSPHLRQRLHVLSRRLMPRRRASRPRGRGFNSLEEKAAYQLHIELLKARSRNLGLPI